MVESTGNVDNLDKVDLLRRFDLCIKLNKYRNWSFILNRGIFYKIPENRRRKDLCLDIHSTTFIHLRKFMQELKNCFCYTLVFLIKK